MGDWCGKPRTQAVVIALIVAAAFALPSLGFAAQGLRAQYYKDTVSAWGQFGSDTTYPNPYWVGIIPNLNFIYADPVNEYFSMRAQGYLYVPESMAGNIEFKTVTDDGARLYIDGNMIINFWRLQSHQTIGTPADECTHAVTINLSAGYHSITMEYFEWEGGYDDPDPCKLYWNGNIIDTQYLYTEVPPVSGLAISNVSAAPSPFNPTAGQTCGIQYTLNLNATVTIQILDNTGALTRTVVNNVQRPQGQSTDVWDGRDDSSNVVPNGAWTYRITAQTGSDTVVYDPGCPPLFQVTDMAMTSPIVPLAGQTSTITYTLPVAATVRLRMGWTMGGGMVRTLVDWQDRPAGAQRDSWDGRDDSGNIVPNGTWTCAIWAYPIPINGIITIGAAS